MTRKKTRKSDLKAKKKNKNKILGEIIIDKTEHLGKLRRLDEFISITKRFFSEYYAHTSEFTIDEIPKLIEMKSKRLWHSIGKEVTEFSEQLTVSRYSGESVSDERLHKLIDDFEKIIQKMTHAEAPHHEHAQTEKIKAEADVNKIMEAIAQELALQREIKTHAPVSVEKILEKEPEKTQERPSEQESPAKPSSASPIAPYDKSKLHKEIRSLKEMRLKMSENKAEKEVGDNSEDNARDNMEDKAEDKAKDTDTELKKETKATEIRKKETAITKIKNWLWKPRKKSSLSLQYKKEHNWQIEKYHERLNYQSQSNINQEKPEAKAPTIDISEAGIPKTETTPTEKTKTEKKIIKDIKDIKKSDENLPKIKTPKLEKMLEEPEKPEIKATEIIKPQMIKPQKTKKASKGIFTKIKSLFTEEKNPEVLKTIDESKNLEKMHTKLLKIRI